jgi:type IV pilus assembly protein PilC
MPDVFEYKVRDGAGKMMSGTLVADSPQGVVTRLREMGYTPLTVGVHRAGVNRTISFRMKIKIKDLAVFSRQFATMVSSGLPILKSLSILEQQSESPFLIKAVAEIRREIERGASLSAAMAKHPKVFNQMYVSMIRSGETGGVLEDVLERLASNIEREVSLRHRIKSAMTYPVVVVCFVTLIMLAMLLFIVPQFKTIYDQLHGTLPVPTKLLLALSDVVKKYFLLIVLAGVGAAFGLRRYVKTERGRWQWDRLKLKIPIFGSLFKKTALARFARVLGMLNRSGVPILQSLDVVADTVNNALMSKAIKDVQESVKQGESLAKPLARHDMFPPMVVQMLAVGEETGALDTMLEKMATFYDEEVTATVDALTSLIEPVMIFVIGGMVGVAVIALYLPMFNVINLIK